MAKILADNLGLTFKVRPLARPSLKETLVGRLLRRAVRSAKNPNHPPLSPLERGGAGGDSTLREVHALENVNLEIGEGERVGIIGHNGAGKSTLLKVLAGIYPPTTGHLHV